MKRRFFLNGVAGFTAAMISYPSQSLEGSQGSGKSRPLVSKKETGVFLAGVPRGSSDEAIKSTVRDALLASTNFSWLSRGDSVFINPALNSGKTYPSTTSPLAVASVIKLLKEKGARRVIVGDMSGIEHVKLFSDSLSGSTRNRLISMISRFP